MFRRDYLKKRALTSGDPGIWCQYRQLRSRTNNEIKKAKRIYFTNNLDLYKHDIKKTWKLINELDSRNNSKTKNISEVRIGDDVITSPTEMAESFNSYFSNVAVNLAAAINVTGNSPFFLSHGYISRTPRLVVAPPLTKNEQSTSQWAATLSSRLKEAHLGAQAPELQTKQRRVPSSEETCSELHVGDSVMMYVPPKPGFPTKLQDLWQGPYVVKCFQGNTYRLKHQQYFRKRVLRQRDQLRVVSSRSERLRPKIPATPEREEPHTTSQTLQQDGHPSSLTTATSEKPAGSCAGTARGTREETDVKSNEQQLDQPTA